VVPVLQLHAGMKLRENSSRLSNVVFVALGAIAALQARAVCAQDLSPLLAVSSKLEAPKPKALNPSPGVARSPFALDHRSIALGLVLGGAELFDGIGTHHYVNAPTCRSCIEGDPVCRLFLGPRPTWPRMLTLGAMEDLGAVYLHQRLRQSPHKLVRWLAPAAPLTLIAIHIDQGIGVFNASTNPCAPLGPGYVVATQSQAGDQLLCNRPSPALVATRLPNASPGRSPRHR
jgi:hypothetical protein